MPLNYGPSPRVRRSGSSKAPKATVKKTPKAAAFIPFIGTVPETTYNVPQKVSCSQFYDKYIKVQQYIDTSANMSQIKTWNIFDNDLSSTMCMYKLTLYWNPAR